MATSLLTALGLSGVGVLGFLGIHRGLFLSLAGVLVALAFYLNVVRRRSPPGIVLFAFGASFMAAAAIYALGA